MEKQEEMKEVNAQENMLVNKIIKAKMQVLDNTPKEVS